jgi:hypothetical protein
MTLQLPPWAQGFNFLTGTSDGTISDLVELQNQDNDSDRDQDDPTGLSLGESDDGTDQAQRETEYTPANVTFTQAQVATLMHRLMFELGSDNPMPTRATAASKWLALEVPVFPGLNSRLVDEDMHRKSCTFKCPATSPGGIYLSPYPSVPLGGAGGYYLGPGDNITLTHNQPVYAGANPTSTLVYTNMTGVTSTSSPTQAVPAGAVGPVSVVYNSATAVLLLDTATGRPVTRNLSSTSPYTSPVVGSGGLNFQTATSAVTFDAFFYVPTAGTAPCLVEVSVERFGELAV